MNYVDIKIFLFDSILKRKDLKLLDKVLLSYIVQLDNDRHCFAGNKTLAQTLGVTEVTISKSISKMMKLGLLELVSFDGWERVIRCTLTASIKLSAPKKHTGLFNKPLDDVKGFS
jgi:hypothetical protein